MSTQTAKTRFASGGTSGGGGVPLTIQDEGGVIVAGADTINFVGAGVTATPGAPGEAIVTIPGGGGSSGVDLQDGGVPVAGGPFTTLNFTNNSSVTNAGGGVADITMNSTALNNTRWVAKNGLDTNDGSIQNPFLTIQKGIDDLAGTSSGTVMVAAGNYIENIQLRPNIAIVGMGGNVRGARLQGNITLHPTFTGATAYRNNISSLLVVGNVNIDYVANAATDGRVIFQYCVITGTFGANSGASTANGVVQYISEIQGSLTISGGVNSFYSGNIIGSLTFNAFDSSSFFGSYGVRLQNNFTQNGGQTTFTNSVIGNTAATVNINVQPGQPLTRFNQFNTVVGGNININGNNVDLLIYQSTGKCQTTGYNFTSVGSATQLYVDADTFHLSAFVNTGTSFLQRTSDSYFLEYDPATPAKWSVGLNNVKTALDEVRDLIPIGPAPGVEPAGNQTLDFAVKPNFEKVGGNATITFSNLKEGQVAQVVMQSTGVAYAIVWAGEIFRWSGGAAPTPTATAARYDIYTFRKINGIVYAYGEMDTF